MSLNDVWEGLVRVLLRGLSIIAFMSDGLTATAKQFFTVKIINGAIPEVWSGGSLDGLEYFPITLDGVDYLLTFDGLFISPCRNETDD